jgi:mannose-6-phosphate isomerase-like protein (cupin superfamily)
MLRNRTGALLAFEKVWTVPHVLDGTLTVRVGDERIDAPTGSYVCIPPGGVLRLSF